MRCGAYVVYEERRRKGSGKPYMKKVKCAPSWIAFVNPDGIPEGAERCDGNIIATVAAVDEPYMGGTSAKLEIEYKCDKCGETFYNELPEDAESLSTVLTQWVAGLPDGYRDERLQALWDERLEYRRRMDEHLASWRSRTR